MSNPVEEIKIKLPKGATLIQDDSDDDSHIKLPKGATLIKKKDETQPPASLPIVSPTKYASQSSSNAYQLSDKFTKMFGNAKQPTNATDGNVGAVKLQQQQGQIQDNVNFIQNELPKRQQAFKDATIKKQAAQQPTTGEKFDPEKILTEDVMGEGKDAALHVEGVNRLTNNQNRNEPITTPADGIHQLFDNNGANLKVYYQKRLKDFDEQQSKLQASLMNIQQEKVNNSPTRGDLQTSVQKPHLVVKQPDAMPQNEKDIYNELNDLKVKKQKLSQAVDYYAKKYAIHLNTDGDIKNTAATYGDIVGDKNITESTRLKAKGIPVAQDAQLNEDLVGLNMRDEDLEERYAGKEKDEKYWDEKYAYQSAAENAINKYPELKSKRMGLFVAQKLGKDAMPLVMAASNGNDGALKALADKTGLKEKDLKFLKTGDIPSEGFLSNIGKGVYNAATGLVTGANRLVGGALGVDPDLTTYQNKAISESGDNIFGDNPYEHTIQPNTIIDKNLNEVPNPKAGKYNYNGASIKNFAGHAIGSLAGVIGGTKGLGAAGLGEDVAMATNVIGGEYEDNYQQAQRVMGKDASEVSKHLYALGIGGIHAAVFQFLPKEKLGLASVDKGAEKEFADLLKSASVNDLNEEALKKPVQKIIEGIAKSAGESGKLTLAQKSGEIATHVVRALVGNKEDGKENMEELAQNFDPHSIGESFMGNMIPLSIAEIPNNTKNSVAYKEGLYDAGLHPETYHTQLAQDVEAERISPEDAQKKAQVIDTMDKIVQSTPDHNPQTGEPLTAKGKVEYAYNRVKEIANQARKERVKDDPALSQFYDKNAKELVDERKSIIEGTHDDYLKTSDMYDRIREAGTHNKELNAGTKTESVTKLQEQALSDPITTKKEFKGDEDLTIDLIARNTPLEIKSELKDLKEKHNKLIEGEKKQEANELQKHIDLLQGGLDEQEQGKSSGIADENAKSLLEKLNKPTEDITSPKIESDEKANNAETEKIGAEKNAAPEEGAANLNLQNEEIKIPNTKESEGVTDAATDKTGEEAEGNTGIKKDITVADRTQRKLPALALPKLGTDAEVLSKAKEDVDTGRINPREVVDRVIKDKGIFTPEEAGAVQYYKHQLVKAETDVKKEINSYPENSLERAYAVGKSGQISDEMDAVTEASRLNSRAWGNLGNVMQIETDQNFNPSSLRSIIKENYAGDIPKEVQSKIDEALKMRDTAIEELRQAKEDMAASEIKKAVGFEQRKAQRKQTKEELKQERTEIIEEIKKAVKKDLGNINSGVPIPTATLTAIGKLAVNYFKDGVVTIEGLTDKIYTDLKEFGYDKKAIREAISNYNTLKYEAHDKAVDKIEKKSSSTWKKIASGEFSEKPKSNIIFRKSMKYIEAEKNLARAEFILKNEKRKSFESQKNWYQKGLMWLGRGVRLSVLSGYNVLGKLAAAATIGAAAKRIPEQVIGGVYSKIFKGIAEKAPIEGYLNAKSEAQFYREFFNLKKFGRNSWQILKTGASDLSKKHSGGEYEHIPILYLPTDLHQIIKDPVKRATYEASFRNGLIWAEKNGLDINDDLVVNSLQNAAYKRAQYEIFQEHNTKKIFNGKVSNPSTALNNFKAAADKAGNSGATAKFLADFLIPVSTVPANIIKRIGTTSPLGLIRGSKMVIDAYRKGIENLSNEDADRVMRQLKQGSVGTALWLIGWYGASSFGGLYSKFNPDKKRREGDLVHDEMSINGEMIPKPVQHALPLEVMQLAATARRIFDKYNDEKDASTPLAIYHAAMGSIGAMIEQIPVIEIGAHLVGATNNPYEAEKLKEDIKGRVQPQILKETGIIQPKEKEIKIHHKK